MKRIIVVLLTLCFGTILLVCYSVRERQTESKPVLPSETVVPPVPESESPPNLRHALATAPRIRDTNTLEDDEQVIEVDNFWGGSASRRLTKKEYDLECAAKASRVQEVITADIADGINAEVRQREAQLRQLCQTLSVGMTTESTVEVLGAPSAIKLERDSPSFKETDLIEHTNSPSYVTLAPGTVRGIIYRYSPRDGLPFDQRNGWGYQILFLCFDSDGQLLRWLWDSQGVLFSTQRRDWQTWAEYRQGNPQN